VQETLEGLVVAHLDTVLVMVTAHREKVILEVLEAPMAPVVVAAPALSVTPVPLPMGETGEQDYLPVLRVRVCSMPAAVVEAITTVLARHQEDLVLVVPVLPDPTTPVVDSQPVPRVIVVVVVVVPMDTEFPLHHLHMLAETVVPES